MKMTQQIMGRWALTGLVVKAMTSLLLAQEVGIGTTSPAARLDIQVSAAYAGDLLRVFRGTNTYLIVKNSGRVGIGTSGPVSRLHVANDGMIYAEGTYGTGDTIPSGNKTAFIWNPRKAAIRAGRATGNRWDNANVGAFSTAWGFNNIASGFASMVGGGYYNTASGSYSSACGYVNIASGYGSTISGGYYNKASNNNSTVGGGAYNAASGYRSVVSGGSGDSAIGSLSTVSGGGNNSARNGYTTVGGGAGNTASGYAGTVSGGYNNTAGGYASTVGGGYTNTAGNSYSTVSGGYQNIATNWGGTVSGGARDTATGYYSTVSGGYQNTASGNYSIVSGGQSNTAGSNYSVVNGGRNNTASGYYSTVNGGYQNSVSSWGSTVNGGYRDTASGYASTVSGGYNNTAGGDYSWVGGRGMKLGVNAHRTFVWGYNSSSSPPVIPTSDAFLIGPSGNAIKVGIGTASPAASLDVNGIVHTGTRIFMQRDGAKMSWIGAQGSGTDAQRTAIGFLSSATSGLIERIELHTNGSQRVTITSSGNVGVGTTTPTTMLDVNGAMRLRALTSAPASPNAGDIYFDGTHFYGYDGSNWKQLDN